MSAVSSTSSSAVTYATQLATAASLRNSLNAIGAAVPLPDGNILVGSCSCTNAGYTGAPEPSNVSLIVDGKQPWKLLKVGVLPDVPVSRESVWYEGPNFGTAYFYDDKTDTLFYYGGFHDYNVGVSRVRHFLHPEQ